MSNELVLAVSRTELVNQNIATNGLFEFDLSKVDQQAYAWLPRHIADNKKTEESTKQAIALGMIFPQILGYFQIMDEHGAILCYQRKGKEVGHHGKWSLGVGGHVSQEDLMAIYDESCDDYPSLTTLIYAGALRELDEELDIDVTWVPEFNSVDDFESAADLLLHTYIDATSTMHVGLPMELVLPEHLIEALKLDPSEFINAKWLTKADIAAATDMEFEPWSQLLIEHF